MKRRQATDIPRPWARRAPARRQGGAALLVLMLVLLSVGAAMLVNRLAARAAIGPDLSPRTGAALKVAKAALIARAVADGNRPGELPCPDSNYDGVIVLADDYTGSNCRSLRGWLPWATLDLPELRDAHGARLWYALSDPYHANDTRTLNPDRAGGLTLNNPASSPDIVAVIIAPGPARGGQNRPGEGDPHDAVSDVGEFLEADNADGNLTTYVNPEGGDTNDRVAVITQAELMEAVQRRVAGEVAVAMQAYRRSNSPTSDPLDGRYPWLSPFPPPSPLDCPSSFCGVTGKIEGQLAFTDTLTPETPFTFYTGLSVTWTSGNAAQSTPPPTTSSTPPIGTVSGGGSTENDMEDAVEAALDGPGTSSITIPFPTTPGPFPPTPGPGATCTWAGNDVVACTGRTDALDSLAGYVGEVCQTWPPANAACQDNLPVKRRYVFSLSYTGVLDGFGSDAGVRVRQVSDTNGGMTIPAGVTTVDVIDTLTWAADPATGKPEGTITATATLTVSNGDTSTFVTGNIYTEPQAPGTGAPGDLPQWFVENDWAQFLYLSYAPPYAPAGSGPCNAVSDCVRLAVEGVADVRQDVDAVVVSAGPLLPGQSPRGNTSAADAGFDGLNAVDEVAPAREIVERNEPRADFNDIVRLISCSPSGPGGSCI